MQKPKKERTPTYQAIKEVNEETGECSAAYAMMGDLIAKFHPHLAGANIALVYKLKSLPDPDGHETLGCCRKCSERDNELHGYDFVIELNAQMWNNPEFGEARQRALLDHELCHAEVALDENGEEKTDARGHTVWRTRKHTIEEFREIVERHGLYKADLEEFAKVLIAKEKAPEVAVVPEPARQN